MFSRGKAWSIDNWIRDRGSCLGGHCLFVPKNCGRAKDHWRRQYGAVKKVMNWESMCTKEWPSFPSFLLSPSLALWLSRLLTISSYLLPGRKVNAFALEKFNRSSYRITLLLNSVWNDNPTQSTRTRLKSHISKYVTESDYLLPTVWTTTTAKMSWIRTVLDWLGLLVTSEPITVARENGCSD